ncbi:hypothetical protein AB0C96_37385 [Streptomyces sp. NPDC048506]|uniref:hypothetical protein n=1 Tax=Streptomyces sp. NPDC048506 TaxID=3155028 RepID=UPI003438F64D
MEMTTDVASGKSTIVSAQARYPWQLFQWPRLPGIPLPYFSHGEKWGEGDAGARRDEDMRAVETSPAGASEASDPRSVSFTFRRGVETR